MPTRNQIVIGSLCYIFHGDDVLLLKRNNPPYQGYWSPPGGKQEFGETPVDCCIREIREETGLTIPSPELRVIQTVIDVAVPIHWQLFVFRATLSDHTVRPERYAHNEGELRWFASSELLSIERPYTDRQHWSAIVAAGSERLWQGKFVYNTPDILVSEEIDLYD